MVFGTLLGGNRRPAVFLGSPEAEAEATSNARVPLTEVYEDFHNLLDGLSGEKFIVVGRKGSGKSAFAEYVYARSLSEPNLHCDFIRKSDSNLERAVQLGQEAGVVVDSESFFRWIIYTSMLRMFVDHPAISDAKEYALLRSFLDKNSGYIKVNELEIKQLVSKHGFDVAVEQFRRFMSAKYNKQVEVKAERAPYFKLLGPLEELLVQLLKSELNIASGNSFVIFFDDLDIGFDALNPGSIQSLVSLLRACRHVNNDVFGKNGISAKAIVLLRDDIEAFLAGREADTAKLFASYSSRINWYQEEYAGHPKLEDELNLKRFINRRIAFALRRSGMDCGSDPWRALIADGQYDRSSFKHIVNQTLFRPRDLLLFFLPLDRGKFSYPLKYNDIRSLVESYSEELAKEIKSELSSFYSATTVETIFRMLAVLTSGPITFTEAVRAVEENCHDVNPAQLLDYLFDRSIIGIVDDRGWYTFKCRLSAFNSMQLSPEMRQRIVVQYGIRTYLRTRGYV
jgi:F0F1-type ATP synthase delta subunit